MKLPPYQLVRLQNGVMSVRSTADGETMHPIIGPAVEAEQLYAKQLRLTERLAAHTGEFVVWDVGLGAAANALAVLRAAREVAGVPVRRSLGLVSFDQTPELLRFGLQHASELGYLGGYEEILGQLLEAGEVAIQEVELPVKWRLHLGDFPELLTRGSQGYEADSGLKGRAGSPLPAGQRARSDAPYPAPHAILFDPYSPAKNPAMWTVPLFAALFRSLDPQRPCSLATYSRSTLIRVALLLAGFFVGAGHASGQKDETTVAANALDLLEEPLDRRWLERARRSDAAEPLWEPVYRRVKLSATTLERLQAHPQFADS